MAETAGQVRLLRFGNFEVDLRAGELRKAGVKLKFGGQPFQVRAVRFGAENVIAGIDRPYITVGKVGFGRAFGGGQMGRGIDNSLAVREEIRTGAPAASG